MIQNPVRISLWSGPRNVSTAMMYSFAQRSQCRVVDEPLYGYYLKKTGLAHPGREDVIKCMETDGQKLIDGVLLAPGDRKELFFKNMAHHFIDLPWTLLNEFKNIFLIREPKFVIESYIRQIETPTVSDLGYDLIQKMTEYTIGAGGKPFIIDTKDILNNPERALKAICSHAGIPFEEKMLKWQAGPLAEDGVWAPYWYKNVHESTGFQPYEAREVQIPKRLWPLLEECQKIYELLKQKTVQYI